MYKATQNQDHGISQNRIELEEVHSFITFCEAQGKGRAKGRPS